LLARSLSFTKRVLTGTSQYLLKTISQPMQSPAVIFISVPDSLRRIACALEWGLRLWRAWAMSSLPDPLGPWIRTLHSDFAISGRMPKIRCISSLQLISPPSLFSLSICFLRSSIIVRSLKNSTAPTFFPLSSRSIIVLTLTTILRLSFVMIVIRSFLTGFWFSRVVSKAHFCLQRSVRKTSKQYFPTASLFENPEISSAALLNDVILHS